MSRQSPSWIDDPPPTFLEAVTFRYHPRWPPVVPPPANANGSTTNALLILERAIAFHRRTLTLMAIAFYAILVSICMLFVNLAML